MPGPRLAPAGFEQTVGTRSSSGFFLELFKLVFASLHPRHRLELVAIFLAALDEELAGRSKSER